MSSATVAPRQVTQVRNASGVQSNARPNKRMMGLSPPNSALAKPTKSPTSPPSAYNIMAGRIANRVAEMAESITFVERPKPMTEEEQERKKPRKLEMRLPGAAGQSPMNDSVRFSPAFLDNTLQMMLGLQQNMLKLTASLSRSEGLDDRMVKEQAGQSAELSRIIAMICAEKARQGA